jgi:hypothetical protein
VESLLFLILPSQPQRLAVVHVRARMLVFRASPRNTY